MTEDIKAKIKAARQENAGDELISFEVPEWSTKDTPFLIYHRPFTLDDVSYVERMSKGDKARSLAYTVIRKAQDENGNKIFTLKELFFLTKEVESQVIVNIVNRMNQNHAGIDYGQE